MARSKEIDEGPFFEKGIEQTEQYYFDKTGCLLFTRSFKPVALRYLEFSGMSAHHITGGKDSHFGINLLVKPSPVFNSALAVAQVGSKFGYIDKSGKIVIPASYDYAFPFSEGIALVYNDADGGKFGYIDANGHEIAPFKYFRAESFSEGLAVVCERENSGYYFIDKTDKRAFPRGNAEYAMSFKDGRAMVGMPSSDASL